MVVRAGRKWLPLPTAAAAAVAAAVGCGISSSVSDSSPPTLLNNQIKNEKKKRKNLSFKGIVDHTSSKSLVEDKLRVSLGSIVY